MAASFFSTTDGDWFVPNDPARGPWDPESCHAGPPTGLLARALEQLLPGSQLVRITVDLGRPVPMAGFRIEASISQAGRTVQRTTATLVDADGRERARAAGLHMVARDVGAIPSVETPMPSLADAAPGPFVFERTLHGLPAFPSGVEMRYPPGESNTPGPTTAWMRTLPLLPDEEMSPFQRICPLADCGNAIGRNADPDVVGFVNPDLTLVLHRAPVGEWLGSSSVSYWEPTGIGFADALLFDDEGVVGRACQTVLLTPAERSD
ncbi:MAG: thioesterase family protein [Actinomycetota bacterium]